MTPAQFEQFLNIFKEFLASRGGYTLTGAADWPLLMVIGGLLVAAFAAMWADLRGVIKGQKTEAEKAILKEEAERAKQDDLIWAEIRRCQEDCWRTEPRSKPRPVHD